jgi:hypothetical protein
VAHLLPQSSFTQAEQSRLAIYKAAVAAGLYTDAVLESPTYRFTPPELMRLMSYKQAIAAGVFTDHLAEENREE